MITPIRLQALDFEIADLISKCPPVWKHPHKRAIHERVRREGGAVSGTLHYSRWKASPLPERTQLHSCELVAQPGYYTYAEAGPGIWHVNFADTRLFAAYGSPLMAQDEWQVLEHPVLGSLREALLDAELPALTRERDSSTPVLVVNAPRQCVIDLEGTRQNARVATSSGGWWKRLVGAGNTSTQPRPLYGTAFQHADEQEVLDATHILKEPVMTHFIAMAAPIGKGVYSRAQLVDVLETACCGFAAAVLESRQRGSTEEPVSIHTGWWGCGAFGGNRVVMAMLQILAARIAGVDGLVFHFGQAADRVTLDQACSLLDELVTSHSSHVPGIINAIEQRSFLWGTPDGN